VVVYLETMSDPCCKDLSKAVKDRVVLLHVNLGTCLLAHVDGDGEPKQEPDAIPINVCPWCGTDQPKKLYKAPFMNYRP